MTRAIRLLLWGTALVALVLAGLALYAYVVGTRTLLEHAEAFSFRRMSVAQLAEQGTFRFFYATNRRPGAVDEDIENRFEAEREASLKYGSFDTKIQPTLGLGMIIDPSDWFLNEQIRLMLQGAILSRYVGYRTPGARLAQGRGFLVSCGPAFPAR